MNNDKIPLLMAILGIALVLVVGGFIIMNILYSEEKVDVKELEDKIEFLEAELAQKNLEYEWLTEITDSLVKEEITEIPIP